MVDVGVHSLLLNLALLPLFGAYVHWTKTLHLPKKFLVIMNCHYLLRFFVFVYYLWQV
jgi:hypothetical protein